MTCRGKFLLLFALILAVGSLGGCSVGMALSGQEDPDLGVLRVGVERAVVETELGSPIETMDLEGGLRRSVYQYELHDEPSEGRAAMHAVLDVMTLGIWELAGTPIEALKGDTFQAEVVYNSEDKVQELKMTKVE